MLFLVLVVNIIIVSLAKGSVALNKQYSAFDQSLYEEALDPELCQEQMRLIRENSILTVIFADAGIRIPKGILQGNNLDLGNYHQCIGFNQPYPEYVLQGKYCLIRVPIDQLNQWIEWGIPGLSNLNANYLINNDTMKAWEQDNVKWRTMLANPDIVVNDRMLPRKTLSSSEFRVAVCIPKTCTTEQAISSWFNVSETGLTYEDEFCRLPNDKPWTPGDYTAVTVFSLLGIIALISTTYDVLHTIILKTDSKTISVIGRSFSVYTNGRRLMTFTSGSDTIECLDGIRALAMAWVIVGHAFLSEPFWVNPNDMEMWTSSWQSLWYTSFHHTVDTFFMLSGLLVVYTTVGKLSGSRLLKKLHLFYVNRLLRVFPILAAAVFIKATLLNHLTDGPVWALAGHVENCKAYWWSALLHVQNFVNPQNLCINPSWYLATDIQLHIFSPIILVWIYGNKRTAWAALLGGLCCVLVGSTIYAFLMQFPSSAQGGSMYYLVYYYRNTLARASPFFVGMVFGYLIRVVKLKMTKIQAVCYWIFIFGVTNFIVYTNYPKVQSDWDNQLVDNLLNSFIRPLWAFVLGLVVYACVNGYGGPINWFLSLEVWKIHSRLSFAMYLFHYGLMLAVNSTAVTPPFFSVASTTFKILAHYAVAFIVSFVMTLLVDSPCSILFKLMLGEGVKKAPVKKQ